MIELLELIVGASIVASGFLLGCLYRDIKRSEDLRIFSEIHEMNAELLDMNRDLCTRIKQIEDEGESWKA